MGALVYRDVLVVDGTRRDLCVDGARIVAQAPPGATVEDGSSWLALPRLCDAHVHLDKCLLGDRWYPNQPVASLRDRVAGEIERLADDADPIGVRADRLLELLVANGSTLIQSHVDVGPSTGLGRLEAVLEVRERWRALADLRIVAFPQEGVLSTPGTVELLREALTRGVDAIGGIDPAVLDGDRDGQLDAVFALAVEAGVRIDIHLHEPGEHGVASLAAIAARTAAHGLHGQVAVSHAYALADLDEPSLHRIADRLAAGGVSLVSSVPGRGRMPPFDALRARGISVVLASDNIRDSWSPYGRGDMLERVCLAGYLSGWTTDAELAAALPMVSTLPATVLGAASAALAPGDLADFTLVRARSFGEAVVSQPTERLVHRRGTLVAANGRVLRSGPDGTGG